MFSRGRFRVGDVVRPRKTGEVVRGEFYRARSISQYACPVSNEEIDGRKINLPFGYYKVCEIVKVLGKRLHLRFVEIEGTFDCGDFDLSEPLYKPEDKVEIANYWGDGPYRVAEVVQKGHRTYLRLAEFPDKEPIESIHYRRLRAAQP